VTKVRVDSRLLASIDYDLLTARLSVEMRDGRTYIYRMVPRGVYEALMAASSKGGFYLKQIRDKYPFERDF
jgi:lysyl-tRNA synthetase class 2